jgi:GntR family transcriptional repressor for pyruvate dehydrogenase complex
MPATLFPFPTTTVDVVQRRLCEQIRHEQLAIGHPLPSEAALCVSLRVSRTVVREALSRLRMLGIVESRRKRGLVLSRPEPVRGFVNALQAGVSDAKQNRDLLELRLVLERGIAEILCERVTEADLRELGKIVEAEAGGPGDPDAIREGDLRFHGLCYQCAGNPLLSELQGQLSVFFHSHLYERELSRRRTRGAAVTHADLLDALKARDPARWRELIGHHLACYTKEDPP